MWDETVVVFLENTSSNTTNSTFADAVANLSNTTNSSAPHFANAPALPQEVGGEAFPWLWLLLALALLLLLFLWWKGRKGRTSTHRRHRHRR